MHPDQTGACLSDQGRKTHTTERGNPKMTTPNTRKVLIVATAVIALTSGCASYRCEHDYGLSKGTADFSDCMVHDEELNLRRAALLNQIGDELLETYHQPVYAPLAPATLPPPLNVSPPMSPPPHRHYCDGYVQGNGSFSATCN